MKTYCSKIDSCDNGRYTFEGGAEALPIGAKVTVEWHDPTMHRCEASARRGKLISRVLAGPTGRGGPWCVTEEFPPRWQGSAIWTVTDIIFCPCCGVRLPV